MPDPPPREHTGSRESSGFHRLDAKGRESRWAREVFHSALAGHINERGAASTELLSRRLGWFWVRLTRPEIEELVVSADRAGVITAEQDRDAEGRPLDTYRWTTTAAGKKTNRPRAGGVTDLTGMVLDQGWAAVRSTKDIVVFVGTVLLAIGIPQVTDLQQHAAVYIPGGLLLTLLIARGLRNERKLAAAMKRWPRMRRKHPHYAAWQQSWPRALVLPLLLFWLYLSGIVAFESGIVPWGALMFGVGLAFGIPSQLWVRSLYKLWDAEVHR